MSNDRLLNFLGLCKRAGCLVSGAQTVIKAVREGKAKLVLYASDVSGNSLKGVVRAARECGVTAREMPRSKEELSFALGKHCGVICTTDDGFAQKILDLIN